MKNWLSTMAFTAIALTFLCCNQQEDVLPSIDNIELEAPILNSKLQENLVLQGIDIPPSDEAVYFTNAPIDEGEKSEKTYDGETGQERFCVYKILTAAGFGCGSITPGAQICVNCPTTDIPNSNCPGDFRVPQQGGTDSPFVYINGFNVCIGTMKLDHFSQHCRACPNGQRGYKFL